MQLACRCLNILISSKGSAVVKFDLESNQLSSGDHSFFQEDIGYVELESIHKEQALLVLVENCGEWVIHRCLSCHMYTHALILANTAKVLVNRALITNPEEVSALKKSEKYSPVFHIVINSNEECESPPISGGRGVPGSMGLHLQLTEWLQREAIQTEERVRQYSEQQYTLLDRLRTRAHRDHLALTRILLEANTTTKPAPIVTSSSLDVKKSVPVAHFSNITNPKPMSTFRAIPVLPDPISAIIKKTPQVANRSGNLARKPSVDAEGLFDLDGMDEAVEALPSEEELSDTDDSSSHDEGIHIPRRMSSAALAKSLPVNVPAFSQNMMGSVESPHRLDYRVPQEPMDIAASIKALAKSVHGDAVFGDLPRPRFSSQI